MSGYNINPSRVGVNPQQVDKNGNVKIPALQPATTSTLGGVKVGNRLTIAEDGTLSADEQTYTLPVAGAETLGGVKIGEGITVAEDGTISVSGGSSEQAVEVITYNQSQQSLDKTGAEIKSIVESGKPVIIKVIITDKITWYYLATIKKSSSTYYFYGLITQDASPTVNTLVNLTITLNNDEISSKSYTTTLQNIFENSSAINITYNTTTDTWTNLNGLNYRTPWDLFRNVAYGFVEITDGTTSSGIYKFMPDNYLSSGGTTTGTVHIGTLVFDYTFTNGHWTLTKQS